MIIFISILHIIVCLFLVIVVLLQSGKAADLAGAFGGMGSQTAFGPRGAATILSKATTVAAALFMVTSLSLAVLYTRQGSGGASSVLDRATPVTQQQKAPAQPAPATNPTGPIQMNVQTPDGKTVSTQQLPVPGQTPAPAAPKK